MWLLHNKLSYCFCLLQLARDVRWLNRATVREDGKHDSVVLATKLVNVGYKVRVRTAMGGGSGQDCFHNLSHEFLIVSDSNQEIIIDCSFKDQFRISQHTHQYQQLLDCLPDVFVGSAMRLTPLIQLLCTEMAVSFKERGFTCPPWRQPRSMISKWLPAKSQDTLIGRNATFSSAASSTSSVSSDEGFGDLLDSGISPTGPLPSYHEHPGYKKCESPGKAGSQPQVTFTGFKVKSLLSSGLAAIHSKTTDELQSWQQPAIRTVRMAGRPLMQAQAV